MVFAPSKSRKRAKIRNMGVAKTIDHIQIIIRMPNSSQEPPALSKAPNQKLKDMDGICSSKLRQRAKIRNLGISKTSDHIQINIKMLNPSQEPPASSKYPNEDLKDMDVCCTFKIKLESQNLDHGCNKDQCLYSNQDQDIKPQSATSSILQSPN